MKKVLLLLVMMMSISVMAQTGCYERNRSKGIEFFNKGDKENAERAFRQALNCADKPADNDIETWLSKIVGDLRLSHESIEFSAAGGVIEVNVYGSDSKIEVSGMPKWCSYEKVLDNNEVVLVFTATPNNTDYSRRSTISIMSKQDNVNLVLLQVPTVTVSNTVSTGSTPKTKADNGKKFRFGLEGGINMPSFSVKSSNVLSSVMDYGQTDVDGLRNNERPNYQSSIGFDLEADFDFKVARNLYVGFGLGYSNYKFENKFTSFDDIVYTVNYTSYTKKYYFDYKYTEKYKFSYLNIPILIKYRLEFAKILAFDVETGVNMAIGLSGKMTLDGNIYADIVYSNQSDLYYSNSNVSGTVELFTNKFDIKQKYTTGAADQFKYSGKSISSPLKRFNCQWVAGASFYVSVVKIGVQYSLGLTNIAEKKYWESGDRVGGLLLAGEPIKSSAKITGYKHKLSSFSVSIGVNF